jgi:hypothetical protein
LFLGHDGLLKMNQMLDRPTSSRTSDIQKTG